MVGGCGPAAMLLSRLSPALDIALRLNQLPAVRLQDGAPVGPSVEVITGPNLPIRQLLIRSAKNRLLRLGEQRPRHLVERPSDGEQRLALFRANGDDRVEST